MGSPLPPMGLTVWDNLTDTYDHTELAANFLAINAHDHSPGKGKQLSGSSLADGSIGTSKIADGSIGTNKIVDKSVTQAKLADNSVGSLQIIDGDIQTVDLADGSVTNVKLAGDVNPIGKIIMWHRVDNAVALPAGYEPCDGRPWSIIPNALGPGGSNWTSGNMPDFRNRFPLGASLGATGSGPTDAPAIGQVGGSMTVNLSHNHRVDSHVHLVNAHYHLITAMPGHKHQFQTTVIDGSGNPIGVTNTDLNQRANGLPTAMGRLESLYVPMLNSWQQVGYENNVPAPMNVELWLDGNGNPLHPQPVHDHGGVTSSEGTTTGGSTPDTNNGLTGNSNVKNSFVGTLFLMRVI